MVLVGSLVRRVPKPLSAFLTFSGRGEPTLHPDFPELAAGVLELRNWLAPAARVAILSNSTRAGDPAVRDALRRLDVRVMKLDVGRDEALRRFNRPRPDLRVESLIEWLRLLGGVTIQALFASGPMGNAGDGDIEAWVEAVRRIGPVSVQLYSLDRDVPSMEIGRLDGPALSAPSVMVPAPVTATSRAVRRPAEAERSRRAPGASAGPVEALDSAIPPGAPTSGPAAAPEEPAPRSQAGRPYRRRR